MNLGNPKKCLICQSGNYKVIFSYDAPDQYEVVSGIKEEGYFRKWVQCAQCGFGYSIYSRKTDVLEKIYTSAYRDKNSPWRGDSPEEVFKRVVALSKGESETKNRIEWIKEKIAAIWQHGFLEPGIPPYQMLDIGGGNGIFAYEFRDNNWLTQVIDPDESSVSVKRAYNIPFIQDCYKPNSFSYKFDLISLVYVLEHASDPDSLLKSLHGDLTKNSLVFIEVPHIINFQRKPAKDDIFHSCHLWMFSPNTLTSLLDRCGFEVLCIDCLKTKRDHYALMVLAAEKYRN